MFESCGLCEIDPSSEVLYITYGPSPSVIEVMTLECYARQLKSKTIHATYGPSHWLFLFYRTEWLLAGNRRRQVGKFYFWRGVSYCYRIKWCNNKPIRRTTFVAPQLLYRYIKDFLLFPPRTSSHLQQSSCYKLLKQVVRVRYPAESYFKCTGDIPNKACANVHAVLNSWIHLKLEALGNKYRFKENPPFRPAEC